MVGGGSRVVINRVQIGHRPPRRTSQLRHLSTPHRVPTNNDHQHGEYYNFSAQHNITVPVSAKCHQRKKPPLSTSPSPMTQMDTTRAGLLHEVAVAGMANFALRRSWSWRTRKRCPIPSTQMRTRCFPGRRSKRTKVCIAILSSNMP